MDSINCPIRQQALLAPNSIAIRQAQHCLHSQQTISYQQLDELVNQLSKQLAAQGVKSAQVVALRDHNSVMLIAAIFACLRLGAIACPISYLYQANELDQYLEQVGFDYFWQSSAIEQRAVTNIAIKTLSLTASWQCQQNEQQTAVQREKPAQPITLNAKSIATLIFTSGSSGTPKAAAHSLANHFYSALGSQEKIKLEPNDCWLASLPVYHIGGLAIIMRCFFAGASIALTTNKALISTLTQLPISHASMVPTQLNKLIVAIANDLKHSDPRLNEPKLSQQLSLSHLILGGAPISENLLRQTQALDIKLFYSYGLTEMCSQVATEAFTSSKSAQGFSQPLAYRQWQLVNGEIAVRGETLFLGYLQHKQLNLPLTNGWFYTKDLAEPIWEPTELTSAENRQKTKEPHQIKIVGRKDNMFICGGENYQPEAIEALILSSGLVENVVIVGKNDDKFGKIAVAFVLWQKELNDKNHQHLSCQLVNFLADKLVKIFIPKQILPWPENHPPGMKIKRAWFEQLVDKPED